MSSNNNNNRDTDSHTLIENETEEQSKNDGITSKAERGACPLHRLHRARQARRTYEYESKR
jgi:hypothetical protein